MLKKTDSKIFVQIRVRKKDIRNKFAWISLGWDCGRLARTNDRRSTVKPSPN